MKKLFNMKMMKEKSEEMENLSTTNSNNNSWRVYEKLPKASQIDILSHLNDDEVIPKFNK